jgi:hypothetical protein
VLIKLFSMTPGPTHRVMPSSAMVLEFAQVYGAKPKTFEAVKVNNISKHGASNITLAATTTPKSDHDRAGEIANGTSQPAHNLATTTGPIWADAVRVDGTRVSAFFYGRWSALRRNVVSSLWSTRSA